MFALFYRFEVKLGTKTVEYIEFDVNLQHEYQRFNGKEKFHY